MEEKLPEEECNKVHPLWQKWFMEGLERRYGGLPDEWRKTVLSEGWGAAGC